MEILIRPKNKTQADALKTIFKDMQLKFEEKNTTEKKAKQTQRNKFERDLKQAMKEMRLIEEGKLEGINGYTVTSKVRHGYSNRKRLL